MQVGRSKCSGCCRCAGELVDLALVGGVSGMYCSFAPRMFGGGFCVLLSVDVAPREGTVIGG